MYVSELTYTIWSLNLLLRPRALLARSRVSAQQAGGGEEILDGSDADDHAYVFRRVAQQGPGLRFGWDAHVFRCLARAGARRGCWLFTPADSRGSEGVWRVCVGLWECSPTLVDSGIGLGTQTLCRATNRRWTRLGSTKLHSRALMVMSTADLIHSHAVPCGVVTRIGKRWWWKWGTSIGEAAR